MRRVGVHPNPAAAVGRQRELEIRSARRGVIQYLVGSRLHREQVRLGSLSGAPVDVRAVGRPYGRAGIGIEVLEQDLGLATAVRRHQVELVVPNRRPGLRVCGEGNRGAIRRPARRTIRSGILEQHSGVTGSNIDHADVAVPSVVEQRRWPRDESDAIGGRRPARVRNREITL